MRFLTVESNGVAFHSFCSEHRRQRQAHAFEDRTLLDVQLDVGGGVFLLAGGFAETIDLNAAASERVFKTNAVAFGAHAVSGDAGGTSKGRRAEKAAAEARAFLVGPIHQADRDRRAAVEFLRNTPNDFEARKNVERTIEPAAVRNGIKVAADQQGFFGLAGEGDPVVAGDVVVMFDRKAR